MQDALDRMRDVAARHHRGASHPTALPRVTLHAGRITNRPRPSVYEPSLCLVLQGAKQVVVGDRVQRYDTANYFLVTVDLPVTGWVVEGEGTRPYLSVSLRLDRTVLSTLIPDMPGDPGANQADPAPGFATSPVTPGLLDAWSRLLCLLDTPEDAPVLAPLHEREVLYRLLKGPHRAALCQAAQADGRLARINRTAAFMRECFDKPIRIEQLAHLAGMSPATFHRHFKAATTMSPLQYQKVLRLQQARRLLVEQAGPSRAGHAVGYESASQFNREYARMFGLPPGRDAERMRDELAGERQYAPDRTVAA